MITSYYLRCSCFSENNLASLCPRASNSYYDIISQSFYIIEALLFSLALSAGCWQEEDKMSL